ncbi:transposase [Pseudomonas sp. ANT_J28]|nr:transposase [Pseudomonas sp. ANT_J28]KAA0986059.1 transposase [Pseudomonas sp. ANT_J28]
MTDKRKVFDDSFKLEVVKMIRGQNLSVAQVCGEQGLIHCAIPRH